MKTTANPLDPNIETTTNRLESKLDSPLKRLCQSAMSGEEVVALLQQYRLLPQLQRELILDTELASVTCSTEEVFGAYKAFYHQHQINSDADRDNWLERNHMTLSQFERLVMRTLKLDRFKRATFGSKVNSYFLQRKRQLDRAIYSLLRVKDLHLAQELFFRIQDGESTFAELASQYSGGQEAETGGSIGPCELSTPHPDLAQKLVTLPPGQLSPPMRIGDWFVLVRLEKYLPAQLDEAMQERLINELYEQWIQEKLATLRSTLRSN